ncbi:Uncharacterised protein [Mycobacteroides abscessus subsp. abscessus]|nr:Uncharacterised protein [Mycobacteroides abscessus subsp. abscessus]
MNNFKTSGYLRKSVRYTDQSKIKNHLKMLF